MGRVLKVVFSVLVVLLVVAGVLFGVNRYNSARYAMRGPDFSPDAVMAQGHTERVVGEYLNGFYFPASSRPQRGVVVVFGGSEGSANPRVGRWLQDAGYNVLALYFFGQPNQQPQLSQVPLEFFQEALDWIHANVTADGPITVLGLSKGAELAANLAVRYPQIDNVICYSPAEFTYSGLNFSNPAVSSFTYLGVDVPFLSYSMQGRQQLVSTGRYLLGLPSSYRAGFAGAAEHATAAERAAAAIDLSDFAGNLLLLAGSDDAMWPSDVAARRLASDNSRAEAVIYPDAGHIFAQDITVFGPGWEVMLGGSIAGNREAKVKSDALVLERLGRWHR